MRYTMNDLLLMRKRTAASLFCLPVGMHHFPGLSKQTDTQRDTQTEREKEREKRQRGEEERRDGAVVEEGPSRRMQLRFLPANGICHRKARKAIDKEWPKGGAR